MKKEIKDKLLNNSNDYYASNAAQQLTNAFRKKIAINSESFKNALCSDDYTFLKHFEYKCTKNIDAIFEGDASDEETLHILKNFNISAARALMLLKYVYNQSTENFFTNTENSKCIITANDLFCDDYYCLSRQRFISEYYEMLYYAGVVKFRSREQFNDDWRKMLSYMRELEEKSYNIIDKAISDYFDNVKIGAYMPISGFYNVAFKVMSDIQLKFLNNQIF